MSIEKWMWLVVTNMSIGAITFACACNSSSAANIIGLMLIFSVLLMNVVLLFQEEI